MYRFTIAMMIFVLGLGSYAADAAPLDGTSVVVRFGDLDLSSSEGVATLYQRLRSAAEMACGVYDTRDPARRANFNVCVETDIGNAVVKIGATGLTRYYEAKTQGHSATTQKVETGAATRPQR